MKRVAIITLTGDKNYGNKFQNYAMQTVLTKFNLDVSTILLKSNTENVMKTNCLKAFLKKLIEYVREKRIKNFSKKYINNYYFISYKQLKKDFDCFCIGSDQIWNPYFLDDFYFSYAKFTDRAFSYAASFGIDDIPRKYTKEIKDGLCKLNNISVREETGANIVEQLTNKRPIVALDPVLLLDAHEWKKISASPIFKPKKKYIVTYYIGKCSEERRDYVKKIAKDRGLSVVNLGKIKNMIYYLTNPMEFLYFWENSEMVFTDSFHGVVFSILFQKPFYIFEREDEYVSMNSRIETLLNKFCLTDRTIKDYNQNLTFECDFSKTDEILRVEREKSLEYLKNALDIK